MTLARLFHAGPSRAAVLRSLAVALVAACLILAGCGDDDGGDGGGGGAATGEDDAGTAGEPLRFEQIEDFTIETLRAEPAVREECSELAWLSERERREKLPRFVGVERVEALACEGVPYLVYYVFPDEKTAGTSLGQSALPYLVSGGSTAVQPLVAVDERAALRYLEALREECGCGEIVKP